ncbi:MAG: pyridoxamine 5'-phosphate oxidase family protein [Desulfuromonadales bacterium]
MTDGRLRDEIGTLLQDQRLAVLATSLDGHPYTTLVAFAASDDLRHLFFATTRATRKYSNLTSDSRVSLLVDSRRNETDDFRQAAAVTAIGQARPMEESGTQAEARRLYLGAFPYLREFLDSPTCVLVRVDVRRYIRVDRFQHVLELDMIP